ncbi:MAG: DUF58 domain-containing protein [Azospirillaceae bacterium]
MPVFGPRGRLRASLAGLAGSGSAGARPADQPGIAGRHRGRAEALSATLPPLLVEADRVAATVAQGVHGRRRVGTGESFWQFRGYQPGDPVSRIDWRQSAKTQSVYIRELEWEAAQSVWLWADRSPSMNWRSAADLPTKADRAAILLLALSVLLSRAGERVALLGGDRPPASGRASAERLALALERTAPGEGAESGVPPEASLPRHAELVVAGDLLAPMPEIEAFVAAYTARGVRGHMVQVLDPAEATLPYRGRVRFAGLESGEDDLVVPRVEAVRDAYLEALEARREGLAALARAAGWSFLSHRTDRPAAAALLSLYGALAREPVAAEPAAAGAA